MSKRERAAAVPGSLGALAVCSGALLGVLLGGGCGEPADAGDESDDNGAKADVAAEQATVHGACARASWALTNFTPGLCPQSTSVMQAVTLSSTCDHPNPHPNI